MRDITGLTNLVLIGMMGTGKTTVGKRLAQRLDTEFFDSDLEVESTVGIKIPEIFSRYGEIRFRSEEKLVVRRLAALSEIVLATGGGAVLDQDNMAALKRTGILITLRASPEEIFERANRKGDRPLLRKDNSLDTIQNLLEQREFAYRQGDIEVDTSTLTPEEVTDIIIERLKEKGYGKGQG